MTEGQPALGATRGLCQPAWVELESADLERVFRDCFYVDFRTVLIGGGEEPLYLPSPSPTERPHRIVYRADYCASGLHEVAHWCLAGVDRRRLEDYGYWYAPDGRSAAEQSAFEQAEVRPQALEWILTEVCGFEFNMSADNLESGVGPSPNFARAVERERDRILESGLPDRAERFRAALAAHSSGRPLA